MLIIAALIATSTPSAMSEIAMVEEEDEIHLRYGAVDISVLDDDGRIPELCALLGIHTDA